MIQEHSSKTGGVFRGRRILDEKKLSNGWYIIKVEGTKSPRDFKVIVIYSIQPRRFFTPKHAHFAIDLYGKLCADRSKARAVLDAVVEVWRGEPVEAVLNRYRERVEGLPGYDLEYILYALNWILEQEDINFTGRSPEKQEELDNVCRECGVTAPPDRRGSQLAIALLCSIILGKHPVEALLEANLDIKPRRR